MHFLCKQCRILVVYVGACVEGSTVLSFKVQKFKFDFGQQSQYGLRGENESNLTEKTPDSN